MRKKNALAAAIAALVGKQPSLPAMPEVVPGSGTVPDEGGGGSSEWLNMALGALGGAPDRSAYTQPFDQAATKARGAYDASLPQIAQGYDQLRGNLAQSQAGVDQAAGQAQGNMQTQQAATQAQLAAMVAPVLAQLKAAGGQASVGSLTGAQEAQVATGQAQLAQQAAAQNQLSQNLQQAGTQSYNSRVQDTGLAQEAATANAGNNLNTVLNALESRKADALRQYGQDSQQHASASAQARMSAADREADAPGKAIDLERAQIALERDKLGLEAARSVGQTGGVNKFTQALSDFQTSTAEKNPVAFSLLTQFLTAGGKDGTPLPVVIANIRSKQDGGGKIRHAGKNIDANWLIDRAKELDELERLQELEDARLSAGSKS